MAKILLGATIGDARGSVGGVTYTKNRFGAALRQKVSPVQPRTARSLVVRGLFGLLAKRWSDVLTDGQRLAWIALANANPRTNIFGNSIMLTGLQMYESCNRNLQNVGAPIIDDVPANLDVTGLVTLTPAASRTANTFSVAYTATPVPAAHSIVFEATLQVNAGRSFVSSYYKFIQRFVAAQASPADIFDAYVAVHGTLRIGQRLMVRAFQVGTANGAASTPLVATTIVV